MQPAEINPGEKLNVTSLVEVSGISGSLEINLERQIVFENKPLFTTPKVQSQKLTNGSHKIVFEITIPSNAHPGSYKFVTTLRAAGIESQKETLFLVR